MRHPIAGALAALVICLLTAAAFGQGSQNAVGFGSVQVDRGAQALTRYDFIPMGYAATVANVLGTNSLPSGTTVYIWDKAGQKYELESLSFVKGVGLSWSPGTNMLDRGVGFWVLVPGTVASNSYTVYMWGEVPGSNTAPSTSVSIYEGLNLIGYPYPAEVLWTNTELAKAAATGDTLYTYTTAGYLINKYEFIKGIGVSWSVPTQVLFRTEGYWFRRTTNAAGFVWTEPKPYTWP